MSEAAASSPSSEQPQESPLDLDQHVALLEKHPAVAELLRARSIVFIADFLVRNADDALRLAHVSRAHRDAILNHTKDAVFSRIAQVSTPHLLFAASPALHWLRDKTQRHVADPALKDIIARCQQDETLKGPSEIDKHILLVCKDILGFTGKEADTWKSTTPISKLDRTHTRFAMASVSNFYGIDCNDDGRVTKIDLDRRALTGSIPSALSQLTQCEWISMNCNALNGHIPPSLGLLKKLHVLALLQNLLSNSIPPELGDLKQLQWLELRSNRLSGPIPHELAQLSELRMLDLRNNSFDGRIPEAILKMPRLKAQNVQLDETNK